MSAPTRAPRPARRGSGGSRATALLALALVALVVALAHGPVLRSQALCLDDDKFVEVNPLVHDPGWHSVGRFFAEVTRPSTVPGYYLPLAMTSLMLDWAMGGRPNDLHVFHRTSLLLHVAASVLVALLALRLFGAWPAAVLAGLLFGLHPLTVEPVAWVGERKTLLAAFFALGALLCWVERVQRGGARWTAAAALLYLLALLSKPTVVPFPLLLLALDFWPLRRLGWRAVAEKWPFWALSAVSGVITLVSHAQTVGVEADARGGGLVEAATRGLYLPGFYVGRLLGPNNLTPVYQLPVPMTLANPQVLVMVAMTLALTGLALLLARRWRAPLMAWAFLVLALAPTLGVVRYSWVAASDKYAYLPMVGVALALAGGCAAAWRAPRMSAPAARGALALVALLVLGAEARGVHAALGPWHDSLALRRHVARLAPGEPAAHIGLGTWLERAGDHAGAIEAFRRAVDLDPGRADARLNLGIALERAGHWAEARAQLEAAAAGSRSWLDPANELAWLLATCPDPAVRAPAAALRAAARAVELSGGHDPNVLDTQAAALAAAGRFSEAAEVAARAREIALAMNARDLAAQLEQRRAGYLRGEPYVQPAPVVAPRGSAAVR